MKEEKIEDVIEQLNVSEEETDGQNEVLEVKKKNKPLIVLAVICIAAIVAGVVYLVCDGMGVFGGNNKIKKLADYKNYSYEKTPSATEGDAQAYYEYLVTYQQLLGAKALSKIENSEGMVVEDGEVINVTFKGYMDGEAFDGGEGTTDLEIGSNTFIDTFEEQLIGHKIGETFDINVTFPEEYKNNPDLAGKPAVFTVTLNYKNKSEDVTVENGYTTLGFSSKDECMENIKSYLDSQNNTETIMRSAYSEYLLNNTEFEDLTEETDKYYNNYVSGLETMCKENSATLATFATNNGYESEEALREALKTQSEQEVKLHLLLTEIGEQEKIKLSDQDFNSFAEEIISGTDTTVEEYQELYDGYYGENSFKEYVTDQFIFDKIYDKYAAEDTESGE